MVGSDLVWCCWDEETLGKKQAAWYLNGREKSDSSPESHDVGKQHELWKGTVELVGLKEGETCLKKWQE